MKYNKGKFISFEGIDGSGKSSAIEAVGEFLAPKGIEYIITRQPGGTPLGDKIREILKHHPHEINPLGEVLLLAASFQAGLYETILPALEEGKWVLCDRYTDSTIAYQCGGKRLNEDTVRKILTECLSLNPEKTFYYDLPSKTALDRVTQRGNLDNFEKRGYEFQENVRQKYLDMAHKDPQRYTIIDTLNNDKLTSIKLTLNEINNILQKTV
jgi:dTMP kinase